MWAGKANSAVGRLGGGGQRVQLRADRKVVEVVFGVDLEREWSW